MVINLRVTIKAATTYFKIWFKLLFNIKFIQVFILILPDIWKDIGTWTCIHVSVNTTCQLFSFVFVFVFLFIFYLLLSCVQHYVYCRPCMRVFWFACCCMLYMLEFQDLCYHIMFCRLWPSLHHNKKFHLGFSDKNFRFTLWHFISNSKALLVCVIAENPRKFCQKVQRRAFCHCYCHCSWW